MMKAADYIVEYLIRQGVTDTFGIPGGVILELLYAMDRRKEDLKPHLSYHEQAAAFAACGYAQASGKPGCAYATRGPGILNMATPMADAFYDSIPVVFFTAHASSLGNKKMRIESDQELDSITILSSITKYSARVDTLEGLKFHLKKACFEATTGRKGPVLLDISTAVLSSDMQITEDDFTGYHIQPKIADGTIKEKVDCILELLTKAKRPVLLIGDGIRQAGVQVKLLHLMERLGIPVLSSRFSHDIAAESEWYCGYIGSHGIRCANFILSKADLILALGNRMAFPVESPSFKAIMEHSKFIRVDVDETEFQRKISGTTNIHVDLQDLMPELERRKIPNSEALSWRKTCRLIKKELWDADLNKATETIEKILQTADKNTIVTSDVGNNEFWLSRAAVHMSASFPVLYSKSFGALGCSLGKAIGAYYAFHRPVLCFSGDQGIQMNIQELQYVGQHRLPLVIILLNNKSSGMIKSRERKNFSHFLHTTQDSGYSFPDFASVAKAYGLNHYYFSEWDSSLFRDEESARLCPCIIEVELDAEIDLEPNLPKGVPCQALEPALSKELYEYLLQL